MLVDGAGSPLGALPTLDVEIPYWAETAEIVRSVRTRYGIDVDVLRLLHADASAPPGGSVTYLAQTHQRTDGLTTPVYVDLSNHPNRASFARPGGPAATVSWARRAVDQLGRGPVIAVTQTRTWNLSAIWRLDTPDGPLWIKEVPWFFGHEPAVLRWLGTTERVASFPTLLASDGARMLMAHIPGDDLYGAGAAVRAQIAADLHPVQVRGAANVTELLGLAVPDGRGAALRPVLETVAGPWLDRRGRTQRARLDRWLATALAGGLAERFAAAPADSLDERLAKAAADPESGSLTVALAELVEGLDRRLAAVAACGLPDTLCHGDLHPGNVRGGEDQRNVIIDWGDSFVGNPAFDIIRLVETQPVTGGDTVRQDWVARWRTSVPGSDPLRAVELLRPVAALRLAAVYAHFLANIEPTEHPYHVDDVPVNLAQAALASLPST